MSNLNLFIPLTKVDEEKRLVYGIATQEVVDKSGEVMDYESTKPYFEAWSDDFKKKTGGKSAGCLREMHSDIAAGKLVDMVCNDEEKAIEVCSKVVDDSSWNKVLEGVLTGFSIGGRYVKRWVEDGQRYFTADPVEVSLVDNPCVPTAVFEVVKADGVIEKRRFKSREDDKMDPKELSTVDKTILESFQKALGANDLAKAFSFKEIANRMQAALKQQVHTPFDAGYFWIKDIYPDNVIIEGNIDGDGDTDLYRLTYTIDAAGHISFTGTEMVRVEYVPTSDESGDGDNDADDLVTGKGDEPDQLKKDAEPAKAAEPVKEPEKDVTKSAEPAPAAKEAEPTAEAEPDIDTIIQKATEAMGLAKSGKAISKATMERLVKMSHALNELGASCKCEFCAKSYAPAPAEKAAEPADLNKAAPKDEDPAKLFSKAMEAIENLKKDVTALKSDKEALQKKVTELENEPLPGGPVSTAAGTVNKQVGGADNNPATTFDEEVKAWDTIEKTAKDPSVKQNAMMQKATLLMRKTLSGH